MKSGDMGLQPGGANEFLPCLDAFFYGVEQLIKHPTLNTQELEDLRDHMSRAVVSFERKSREQKIAADLIGHAQYALVAFVDEWVIHHTEMGSEWVTHPLQLEYFGENTAGERFFTLLAQLRLQAERFVSVLELFYFFLELGYQGQYRLQNPTVLLNLRRELLAQIQRVRGEQGKVLSPTVVQDHTTTKARAWFRRLW